MMNDTMSYIRSKMDEAYALMIRKSEDYSKDNITATGLQGIVVRLVDKVSRLQNLTRNEGILPNNESIMDTLQDIANYAYIGQALEDDRWGRSTRFVYLAGPIDELDSKAANGWREVMAANLNRSGISCFNPYGAFQVSPNDPPSETIIAINKFAIDHSDLLIANLIHAGEEGKLPFGTIREIEYAKSKGIRVIVIARLSLNSHLAAYDVEIVETTGQVYCRIFGYEPARD